MNPPNSAANVGESHRVALKLPQFWDKEADLWFINIEAQFVLANVTQDITKYYAVVSALNSDTLSYVSDIVKNPPAEKLYESLKSRLIAEFSDSEQKRLKALLSNTLLGDDKPSHLLRKMKLLATDKIGDDFLKTLWIQRLPQEAQTILSISEGNLDRLAQIADKIIEITPHHVTETRAEQTTGNADVAALQTQIALLTAKVERIACENNRNSRYDRPRRFNSHYRRRSQTPKRQQPGICWYHSKFAEKAKHCTPPCTFKQPEN